MKKIVIAAFAVFALLGTATAASAAWKAMTAYQGIVGYATGNIAAVVRTAARVQCNSQAGGLFTCPVPTVVDSSWSLVAITCYDRLGAQSFVGGARFYYDALNRANDQAWNAGFNPNLCQVTAAR